MHNILFLRMLRSLNVGALCVRMKDGYHVPDELFAVNFRVVSAMPCK